MKTKMIFTTMAAAALLSACSETDAPSTPQPTYDRYVDAREAAARIVGGNQALPTNDRVTMNGAYEIISSDLLGTDSIVGQVRMTADFGNESVSGSLHNNYVDQDGSAEQLEGVVTFSGDIENGTSMVAHGDGILTTVDDQDYDMFVDLSGSFGNSSSSGVNITDGELTGNINVLDDGSGLLYDVMAGSEFDVAECLPAPVENCTP